MNSKKHLKKLAASLDAYEKALNKYSEPVFNQTPQSGGWSLSEVYSHVLVANILGLSSALKCIQNQGRNNKRKRFFLSNLLFLLGRFPPFVRFRVPRVLADSIHKISVSEALGLLGKTRHKLAQVAEKISDSQSRQTIKHPILGYLNAREWVRFVQIHSAHHLKQLERIEEELKNAQFTQT